MAVSKDTNKSFGGLQVRNRNDISTSLFCELCNEVLLDPTQILCCGARLCRWCGYKGLLNSEPFVCPFCHKKQGKKEVRDDRGAGLELNTTRVECYSCPWNGLYKEYKKHLQDQHADFECSDCHEHFYAINPFEEHRQEICDYRCISCGLPGCIEQVKWSAMRIHYLCDSHQELLLEFIIQYFYSKKRPFYNSDRLITTSDVNNHAEQELEAIRESMDILAPGVEALTNDGARLRVEHDQTKANCQRIISEITETKKLNNADNEKVNSFVQSQNEITKEVADTLKLFSSNNKLQLDIDGIMTFSFSKHSDELKSPFSLYSQIFKTASFGYVFILRVCSTIDPANDNQQYLSIYITLLRGDFDAILFYPFPYNISFCLCDQSGQKKHIVSTLKPDPNSPSFACPTSERNDEIGIMKFCPLHYLTDSQSIYLKDEVFFIRIFIDYMNTESIPFD